MTEEKFAELEANLRSVTDQVGGLMDAALQKNHVSAFRCGHSGLLLPADYLRGWGRTYGIGLGPEPVSEVLDTDYDTDPPEVTNKIKRIEQIMHPVGPCFSQLDHVMVPAEVFAAQSAILHVDDPDMDRRVAIVRPKQLVNPRSRLRVLQSKYERG